MSHLAILDVQHIGKPGKADRGATTSELVEADLAWAYRAAARDALEAAGVECLLLSWGWYSDRHAYTRAAAKAVTGKAVYVACHVNAGGGAYGLVCHDGRSRGGKAVSDAVTARLGPLAGSARSEAASPEKWGNAYNTIKGIYEGPGNLTGICYEPGFIDSPAHRGLWYADGLARVGDALAAGILDYLETA